MYFKKEEMAQHKKKKFQSALIDGDVSRITKVD